MSLMFFQCVLDHYLAEQWSVSQSDCHFRERRNQTKCCCRLTSSFYCCYPVLHSWLQLMSQEDAIPAPAVTLLPLCSPWQACMFVLTSRSNLSPNFSLYQNIISLICPEDSVLEMKFKPTLSILMSKECLASSGGSSVDLKYKHWCTYFFFPLRSFQMVGLAVANVFAMALVDFPSFPSFTIAYFPPHPCTTLWFFCWLLSVSDYKCGLHPALHLREQSM